MATKAQRQAAYLLQVSELIYKSRPEMSGRLEWPSLLHFYFTGLSPQAAAEKYVLSRTETA